MGAVTLPFVGLEGENQVRQLMFTQENKLVPSIKLETLDSLCLAESMLILNDEKHVNRMLNVQTRNQTLQLHGVPIAGQITLIREYLVCIFQTHVLLMYRSTETTAWLAHTKRTKRMTYRKVPNNDKGKEVKRVQTLALRALYALGLDYGVVKCGIGAGRKTVILHVNPSPKCNREMENAFIRSTMQYMNSLREPSVPLDKIVLGADPEFVMQSSKGHLLVASKYFPLKGNIGCDAIWIGQNQTHKPVVELRPDPTPDPRTLVLRIYQSLLQAARKMKNVPSKWLAGNMPYNGFPLGGHIHFSGIQPNFKMLRALDNYLSLFFIAVEDAKGRGRRPKYGFLGDFRHQEYGGFEYRTPPSWLVSPTLTKGVFVSAKLIVANYANLQYDPLSEPLMQQAYYKGDKAMIISWVKKLWDDLRNCEDYHRYRTFLDDYYRYITSGVTWDESKDFRKNWKITPFQK